MNFYFLSIIIWKWHIDYHTSKSVPFNDIEWEVQKLRENIIGT